MNEQAEEHSMSTLFSEPRRQHVLSVVRFFVKNGWTFLRSFWPAFAGLAFNENIRLYSGAAIALIVVLLSVAAMIEHWKYTFHIENAALVIHRGLIEREKLVIPIERIQAVHTEQSWWQRIFGLNGLRVDTAGSAGAEVEISALRTDLANQLRHILSKESPKTTSERAVPPLIHLDWRMLLKIGLTQNHLRNAAISFGAVLAFMEPFEDVVSSISDAVSPVWKVLIRALWVLFIPLGILLFGMVGVLVSMLGAVIKYHQLQVRIEEGALEISGGFFRKFSYRIPLPKVQMFELRSSVLQRLAGFESVRIHQARTQDTTGNGGVNLTIPGLNSRQVQALEQAVFAAPRPEILSKLKPHDFHWFRRWLLRISLAFPFMLIGGFWGILLPMVWVLWSTWAVWNARDRFQVGVSASECSLKWGWLHRKKKLGVFHKMQRVSIRTNFLLKRRGLSNVVLHTAAGPLFIPCIPDEVAIRLRDWALMRVEQSSDAWM
jgi:putative membrane protein